ncbi:hypothetical protein [Methylomagnum sp.]
MSVFIINTDTAANDGHSYHNQWFERSVIVTSGSQKFRDMLTRPVIGDIVLVYANGIGVVLIAKVTGANVITIPPDLIQERIGHHSADEHHRKVEYIRDLRQNPISIATITQLLNNNPRHTFQQVRKNLPQLLAYLQAHNLL